MDINEALKKADGNWMTVNQSLGGCEVYVEKEHCKICGSVLDTDGVCENCPGKEAE